jgi:predicted RNA-binding protein YlxR (DUF448 family)/ribosomal protein L30E
MPAVAPQRSCLGCREVKGKGELLRFVLAPDRTLVPDLLAKLPGRGAYTCLRASCLRQAIAKRQFARSFRGEVRLPEADGLVSQVTLLMEERLASYVALANKGGKVVSGTEMVIDLLRRRTPGVIFIASDLAADSRAKIRYLADRAEVPMIDLFDKARLGGLLGKEQRGVVAIEQGGFSETIRKELDRYRNFFEGGVQSR